MTRHRLTPEAAALMPELATAVGVAQFLAAGVAEIVWDGREKPTWILAKYLEPALDPGSPPDP